MPSELKVSVGQYSDKGRKKINQDFHGVYIPEEPQLTSKGIAIALADGISSSDVSQVASEATVSGFLEDYFCTSEAWSVKKSAHRVLAATNSFGCNQLLVILTNPARPVSFRQGQRLCLYLKRDDYQVYNRAYFSFGRYSSLSIA
jgi:hypothetical protein